MTGALWVKLEEVYCSYRPCGLREINHISAAMHRGDYPGTVTRFEIWDLLLMSGKEASSHERIDDGMLINALDLHDLVRAVSHLKEAWPIGERWNPFSGVPARLQQAGVQLIAELAGNWTTPEGGQLVQVVMSALEG